MCNSCARNMHSYHRAIAHLPRVWLHMIFAFERRAIMKSGFISSLSLAGLCMWTPDLFAAGSSSLDSPASALPRGILTVSRYGYSIEQPAQGSEFYQRELSALNLLGIRYAKGQGVKRNPGKAIRFFIRSALNLPVLAGPRNRTGAYRFLMSNVWHPR